MVLENTSKVCNILQRKVLKNSIKDILVDRFLPSFLRRHRHSTTFKWIRLLALLFLASHSYYLFFKTGFHYMLLGCSMMYVLRSLPMPLLLVYGLHKNDLFKYISYAEFQKIARAFRETAHIVNNIDINWEGFLIETLAPNEQAILLRLGAELEDLPLIKNKSSYAHLKRDSLQCMAVEVLVKKTEDSFKFPTIPALQMAYNIAKQRALVARMPIDEDIYSEMQRLHL